VLNPGSYETGQRILIVQSQNVTFREFLTNFHHFVRTLNFLILQLHRNFLGHIQANRHSYDSVRKRKRRRKRKKKTNKVGIRD
jgi:hypothetical protein